MKKYHIGYTTGVFDMFHIGHLRILERAKEMCDILIVGVSTDELVQEYKNKVPIIPFQERMAIVGAIKYVDRVVVQENMDKSVAYNKYNADVVFHGSDWKGKGMWNHIEKDLNEHGVDVIYLDYTEGISSTILREKISNKH